MLSLAVLFDASRIAVQRHICPDCLGPMILTRIKPAGVGFEMRTFQGVNCHHVDKLVHRDRFDEVDIFRVAGAGLGFRRARCRRRS
jgi:hypothetical protein